MKRDKNKVYFPNGVALDDKGKSVLSADLLNHDCGCGINCCDGYIVLPSYNSVTGAITYMALWLKDGVVTLDTVADAKTEITAIKNI